MTKIHVSMGYWSCTYWMPNKEICAQARTADKYRGKNFCRHWELSVKWQIMKEKTETQVRISRWNGSTITHRRLEVL